MEATYSIAILPPITEYCHTSQLKKLKSLWKVDAYSCIYVTVLAWERRLKKLIGEKVKLKIFPEKGFD